MRTKTSLLKAFCVIGALLCLPPPRALVASGQVTEAWVARYNGPANFDDVARAVAVDEAGNVYVTGSIFERVTADDYATIKYDRDGNELWVARYNGPGNSSDVALAIAVDATGNVLVTGWSVGLDTDLDYATISYDPDGNERWVARYNGPGNSGDVAQAIAMDAAGNILVTGSSVGIDSGYDYATISYNPSGTVRWIAGYNGPANSGDFAQAMAVDAAGNVSVTGTSNGTDTGFDYATISYDPDGNQRWIARYNGYGSSSDLALAVAVSLAGNVSVTGWSEGINTDRDYATISYDADGIQQWVARYNGPGNSSDVASAVVVDASGNVSVTGESVGMDTGFDYATISYDADGTQRWIARYSHGPTTADFAKAMAVDAAGNIYVTGESGDRTTRGDYATIKYDSEGNQQWVARYDGPDSLSDAARAVAVDAAGCVYVTGESAAMRTNADYATVKYRQK